MGIKLAIDVSRGRSGGAQAHIIGFLGEANPLFFGIVEVHIWAYSTLLEKLPDREWLVKHSDPKLEESLLTQILWQKYVLPKLIKKNKCDILLSTDAGTVMVYHPSVVMSRDMLPFERSEIKRYKSILPWLRLFILRFIQIRSLKKADGALFLTKYASDVIQTWSGPIKNFRIIPHGVGVNFKNNTRKHSWPKTGSRSIRCLYISNTAMYKHQWHVAEAFYLLRKAGYLVEIEFVGGGNGFSNKLLNEKLERLDPKGTFTKRVEFVAHESLPDKLASADLFVFASSCENMPNTLVEAMSCGLPIACSNLGPMPEVLRDGGVYFHPEDPKSIRDAVLSIIDNQELREKSAKKALIYAAEYSWKRCSAETLQYLVDTYNKASKKNI
jgi:glycosyltransferase involved in cell wall biosynthesis